MNSIQPGEAEQQKLDSQIATIDSLTSYADLKKASESLSVSLEKEPGSLALRTAKIYALFNMADISEKSGAADQLAEVTGLLEKEMPSSTDDISESVSVATQTAIARMEYKTEGEFGALLSRMFSLPYQRHSEGSVSFEALLPPELINKGPGIAGEEIAPLAAENKAAP